MAIAYVENAVAVYYHGITVYHIHKDDLKEQPTRECWFTLDTFGLENSESSFDIRDLAGYDASQTAAANLVQMIDASIFGDTNLMEREGSDQDDTYSTENTHPEQCPVCGAKIEEYGCLEVHDDQVEYPFTCQNCGVSGSKWSKLEFDGFTID